MREIATRSRIEHLLQALGREADREVDIYLVGGTGAVLVGWREGTKDVDLVMKPETDRLLRAIPELKERFNLNIELAAPEHFIPVPPGWEDRSPVILRVGRATFRHYDWYAQALAKLERGHVQDLGDVRAMVERGLITTARVRSCFEAIEPLLYRFPAVDPAAFREAVERMFPPN